MSIVLTLLILGVIIFVHELGHFLSAKLFKMPVSEFALGMGPKIFSKKIKETTYSLRGIPMGGFVNIDGMEIGSEIENGFSTKKPFERFTVLFAGVFMNFITAIFILFCINFFTGKLEISDKPIIGEIIENSAVQGILEKGDIVKKIDDKEVNTWENLVEIVASKKENNINLLILRNNEKKEFNIKMKYDEERKKYLLGISPYYSVTKTGFVESLKYSIEDFSEIFKLTFKGFKMLVLGEVSAREVSGPVGMVKIVGTFSKEGISALIFLIALLSVNVGIFNLLPFPALDGGRIIFIILEMFGINVDKKLEEKFHQIGMILLVCLILIITFNDVLKLFKI